MSTQVEKNQLFIILLIVFIGFVGSSMAYPIFPPLFIHPKHGSLISDGLSLNSRSIFLGIALAAYPFGQFIGLPILGWCSDHYGRKKLLIISLIGSALGYLLSAVSLYFNWLWPLVASRFLTGLLEGNLAIVRAMAADLETISKFKSFGRINGVSAIGYVMGPLLGGFLSDSSLIGWFSYYFPFLLASIFVGMTALLAALKLTEKKKSVSNVKILIWKQFNLIHRFQVLFRTKIDLKHLLIISSIFTFAIDMFYELGPVYLTGLWAMNSGQIAVYNAALSFTLAIGSVWLTHLLSLYFTIDRIILAAMLITSLILAFMSLIISQVIAFFLFGLIGLSIATATTNLTIKISNAADKAIQAEVMGTHLSLRMLGDAFICLMGGFMIISSVIVPIAISSLIALLAVLLYVVKSSLIKKNSLRHEYISEGQ